MRTPPLISGAGHASGLPLFDAQADFRRARRAYAAARLVRRLRGHVEPNRPLTVPDAALASGAPMRLEVVALCQIIGTLEPTHDFDARFRPASELVRNRWERIALARRKGIALPAITLRHQPDGYYVIDGRHRVSVARALGDRDIDAWVIGGGPASPLAPQTPDRDPTCPAPPRL